MTHAQLFRLLCLLLADLLFAISDDNECIGERLTQDSFDDEAVRMKVSLLQKPRMLNSLLTNLEARRVDMLEELKELEVEMRGSCKQYGCDAGFQSSRGCQCTPDCDQYHNCCSDYQEVCQANSCVHYGCSQSYKWDQSCQCSPSCTGYHNCCHDFQTMCADSDGPKPQDENNSPTPDPTSLNSCAHFGCDSGYVKEHNCQCSANCRTYHNCCSDYDAACLSPPAGALHAPAPAPASYNSCAHFGCLGDYVSSQSCQCSPGCKAHNSCCSDFDAVCVNQPKADSCAEYGCQDAYVQGHSCQCSAGCKQFGNCCPDYDAECGAHVLSSPSPDGAASCAEYGCQDVYVPGHSCQCSAACAKFGNCCSDYDSVCSSAPPKTESCEHYGCSAVYVKDNACQCSFMCIVFNNCCSDFKSHCLSAPEPSCRHFGCDTEFVPGQQCQCSPPCKEHSNCCSDYDAECAVPCENVTCATRQSGSIRSIQTLMPKEGCDPACPAGSAPLGPNVCPNVVGQNVSGPGCAAEPVVDGLTASDVDAVADAVEMADMVFKGYVLADDSDCLLWPKLHEDVKEFIVQQARKYGPSKKAIHSLTKLGNAEKTEFYLSIEQVSILTAQLLCGATEVAPKNNDMSMGAGDHPQPFSFGRAMEHWFYDDRGNKRNETWRRTTLVGYGTFDSDGSTFDSDDRSAIEGDDLTIYSGCGKDKVSDFGIADSNTMTVVFAGHYVGGFLEGWDHKNRYGAQEEKLGTLIPELMLATEPLRHMGAGLLSRDGDQDPWLPEGGWYIMGAGAFVKGKGYPLWTSDKVEISDTEDYFPVGNGRRMRKHGLVAILGKPCNDRGSCEENSDDIQYKCYNRQVEDRDLAPSGANLWGIAAGAYDFTNWPAKMASIMTRQQVTKTWTLQAGGWGAGAFGCGTLYGGLVQALAAKKGGWTDMRMCWASREESYPAIDGKMGYVSATKQMLEDSFVNETAKDVPLMTPVDIDDYAEGKLVFKNEQYGEVAQQLTQKIKQAKPEPMCQEEQRGTIQCDKPWNNHGTCISNMEWCCLNQGCKWHENPHEDIRDFVAAACNDNCGASAGYCHWHDDVPHACKGLQPHPTPQPQPPYHPPPPHHPPPSPNNSDHHSDHH